MLEPVPPSRHPVGDHLRAAADRVEQAVADTAGDPWARARTRALLLPWVALASPDLAVPLAEWLRSAAHDAEQIGADVAAVAVADAILGGAR